MELSLWKDHERKRTVRLGMWWLIGIVLFDSVVCTFISHWANSDILISDSVFPSIWAMIQPIVQLSFYWIAFAFFLFLSTTYTLKGSCSFLLIYLACICGRYLVSWGVGALMLKTPLDLATISEDVHYLLIEILGDSLQMGLTVLFSVLILKVHQIKDEISMPLDGKFFRFSDPFLRCMLFSAMIPGVLLIITQIHTDIFIGAASDLIDLLWIIFYYAADIAVIFFGYLAIYLIMSHLTLKAKERTPHDSETVSSNHL